MRADVLTQVSSTQGAASANYKRKKCVETDQGLRSSAAKSICFEPKTLATSQKAYKDPVVVVTAASTPIDQVRDND